MVEDGTEERPGGRNVAQLQARISEPDRGVRVPRTELELFLERRRGLREGSVSVAAPSVAFGAGIGTLRCVRRRNDRARDEQADQRNSHPFPSCRVQVTLHRHLMLAP